MNRIWEEIKQQYRQGSILTRLIIINLAVFVAINLVHVVMYLFSTSPEATAVSMQNIMGWLAVPSSVGELATRPWTVVTYMFLHKDLLHILFNMLWFYWFGRIFLMYIDQKKLLGVYLVGGLSGALLYMVAYNAFPVFSEYVPYSIMLGASASVMAVVFAISFYVPNFTINLLLIGQVKLKYIAIFSIVLDFLMIASSNAGGHISHLGGALFGYLFITQYKKHTDITKWAWGLFYPDKGTKSKKKTRNPHMHVSYKKPKSDMEYNAQKAKEREELDRILDKVAKSGYESLSKKEKEILFKDVEQTLTQRYYEQYHELDFVNNLFLLKKPGAVKKTLLLILLIINSLVATALLLSYLAMYISPGKVFWLPFFGMSYSLFLFLNIGFVGFWAWRKKWVFLISLIVILTGYKQLASVFGYNFTAKDPLTTKQPVKFLSYNVRVFDLYNWSKNEETRDNIFDYIIHQNADIICFQEFFNDKTDQFTTLDSLLKFQKAREVHSKYTVVNKGIHQFGIATFSRYPIVNKGNIMFSNTKNITIYSDIKILNDTIRVYNNHLQSNHFSPDDYQLIDNITKDNTSFVFGLTPILRKMALAFEKRAYQVEKIAAHIKTSPYPVVVCGDFNDTPVSYSYRKMRGQLTDAFIESGFGFGHTIARAFPSFRIDYIFHDKKMQSSNFKRDKVPFSDHYPIHCLLYLSDKPKR